MSLHRIVFYSRNETTFNAGSMRDFVRGVLESCSRHDHLSGLTGALLFNEHFFVQVMEGDPASLSEKLWTLAKDDRHSLMVLLQAGEITKRSFVTWSVGYAGRSPALDRIYLAHGPTAKLDPMNMSASGVTDLIEEFIRSDRGQFVKHAAAHDVHPD